ncbi:transcriptional regulator, AraC family [Marvinbryantia formatexigens DSM 14469]|uniref:Transcriptional regulator, AraC family n=1 Tax=Marvinbryantia formatexigens DSM 14469 TaxID=478749 RepID=C6LL50_9FIRM|nr:helix-turn-helix transcriptional regulator [Marvinbryantia formatexigens]EET58669.1 transcriptional regulator, AraC family [Marvinbryantia formatexigens DSM 14469]UWO23390.1 helix-turn-helix transcriptional regulator [Marvinbryantia formatexigens DSM 14469]SDG38986.1 Helix-turn-helix domain-containing protein [Marvinbryantia formatexigens]
MIYLELFLLDIIQSHSSVQTTPPVRHPGFFEDASPNRKKRLEPILQYMQFHICERLTLSTICEKFSLSRSSLQTLFHNEKGCGAMEYFSELKIQRAKDIIRDGNMNFTEIAYYLSYSSLPYFSRCFKKSTGMSPAKYASSVKGISQALKNAPARSAPVREA